MSRGVVRAAPPLFGAVVGAAVFLLVHRSLPDDAYITLNYARNLAESGHWGLLADRPSNTATSPLNVWLLAAGTVVTGRPVVAVGLVLVATLAVTGWWADRLRHDLAVSRVLPFLVVALLGGSPLLNSTVGLETYLGCAVLLGVGRYAVAGRWLPTGLLLAAAVLVRPDLAVPAVVLAVAIGALDRAHLVRAGLVAAAAALPWHVFAWARLGGFLPDTVFFKSGDDAWDVHDRVYHFADGWLLYARTFPLATVLTLAPALVGLLAASAWLFVGRRRPGRRAALAFAGAGVAHWCAFALLGTGPYPWYVAPSVVCLTVTAGVAAAALPRSGAATATRVAAAALVAGSVVFLVWWPMPQRPIVYNWGTASNYAQVGTDLARITHGEPVAAGWEIGTTAYFCRCPILDHFGDRALADEFVARRLAVAGPVTRAIARANFALRGAEPYPVTKWHIGPGLTPGTVGAWRMESLISPPWWGSLTRQVR